MIKLIGLYRFQQRKGVIRRPEIVKINSDILYQDTPNSTKILYGLETRGDAPVDSDIDILVTFPDNSETFTSSKIELAEILYGVELDTGIVVSPQVVQESY